MKRAREHIYSHIEHASKAAINLGITSELEYRKKYKADSQLPAHPYRIYGDAWESWYVFLGTGVGTYKRYAEASLAAQQLGIVSPGDYRKKRTGNLRLPFSPSRSYQDKWQGWELFLGTDIGKYHSFKEASNAAQKLGVMTFSEYQNNYRKDPRLASRPADKYPSEWTDWPDFLGNNRVPKYETLEEASLAVIALKIKTLKEYKARYKEDPRLVSNPNREYAEEWIGVKEFFGTGKSKYATYVEASRAAIRLGILSAADYSKKHKADPQLRTNPSRTYKKQWAGWDEFLELDSKPIRYPTLEEASTAAIALGISSQTQYFARYKEDQRLVGSPSTRYQADWTSWYDFLGKEKYPFYRTLEEASAATRRLDVKTEREYLKKYRQDPKLISCPYSHYTDWTSWVDFLKVKPNKYKTVQQASIAAIDLQISSAKEYRNRYKEDSYLPSSPAAYYRDSWKNWNDFLALHPRYITLKEASDAAVKLGAVSSTDYHSKYKNNSMLVSDPRKVYADEWISWDSFLKKEPKYPFNDGWKEVISQFLREQANIDTKQWILRKFYFYYFQRQKPTDHPTQLLSKAHIFDAKRYERFIFELNESTQRSSHSIMISFFDWVIDEYCTDEEGNERVVLPGFRNPLKTLLKNLSDALPTVRHLSESNKPVLPLSKADQARKYLFPDDHTGFDTATHLHDLFYLDWYNISKKQIDKTDPDCVWRLDPNNKGGYQIWSPVKAVALYTLLRIPLRGQQILWLDSGEADSEIPLRAPGGKIHWVKNTGSLAGLQKQRKGFIRKRNYEAEGMYITTSKTSNAGYHVPYIPPELTELIIRLRQWQEKYNPLNKLTKWTELDLPTQKSRKILQARGSQAFLFRSLKNRNGEPYKTSLVFGRYLPALLFKIQSDGEELAWKYNSSYKSKYTPHSIRTSLITAYVVDGGVSLAVISKLVGHTSIVMTIYYTKVGHGCMRSEMNRAEKIALSKSVDRIQDEIINDSIEKAKGELFSKDPAFLETVGVSWPKSSYQFTDKGICAMGGGGCDSGGMNELGFPTLGPVVVGYLGRRNCIRCKYFITGPAFIGGLAALCNEILLEINTISTEVSSLEQKSENLKDEKYDAELSGHIFKKFPALKRNEADYEERVLKLDVMLADFAAVQSLIKQCRVVLSQSDASDKKALIASDSIFDMELELAESETDFRLLCEICENATVYTSTSAARAVPRRSQILDNLASTNGLKPMMFSLSEAEQLVVGNQAAELIRSYVAHWDDVGRLISGDILMNEVHVQQSMHSLHDKFQLLVKDTEISKLPNLPV